jgi:hypothetical protein
MLFFLTQNVIYGYICCRKGRILTPNLSWGQEFELLVLGTYSENQEDFLRRGSCGKYYEDFSMSIASVIENIVYDQAYPNTVIAQQFYTLLQQKLVDAGVDTKDMMFIPTIGTSADQHHGVDAVVYIPSLHPAVVTIDVFAIFDHNLDSLKKRVIEKGEQGEFFFQNALWDHKRKLKAKRRFARLSDTVRDFLSSRPWKKDKQYRPENHFIFTPAHASGECLDALVELIVQFFKKVS